MSNFIGIIPARFASSRFPGKPLAEIQGKSMIQRVYEQASKAGLNAVYVATDNMQIYEHVIAFGGQCIITSAAHESGTDRCNECAALLKLEDNDILINIQGDEPFIQPAQITLLCSCFDKEGTAIATLVKQINNKEELESNSIPKVVINKNNEAIYFSRSVIPFPAKNTVEALLKSKIYFKHIGIYAYRVKVLKVIASLAPSQLELTESLEQLRWIENGYSIKTALSQHETIAIDTPQDLEKALVYLSNLS